jgi:hypothetical protein
MAKTALDRLLFRQGGTCFFCDQTLPKEKASIEHLLAKANGGGNDDGNCVACCKAVNTLFGSMSLREKFAVVLKQKGAFRCPGGDSGTKSVSAAKPPATEKTKNSKDDRFDQVVANLKQRGNARPRTLKTLRSSINSIFPKGISDAEVSALIQRLQSTGKIALSGDKVSYTL